MSRAHLPMLTYPSGPFDDQNFIFEIKYDGTRALCYLDEKTETRMINRRGADIYYRYPEFEIIKKSVKAKSAVLDGEVVVFDSGRPSFPKLQIREHASDPFRIKLIAKDFPATFVVFDVLELEGRDLRFLPLLERKAILKGLVVESGHFILSEFVAGKGNAFFEKAKEAGFEGIIAKRKDSPYEEKRSRSWLKVKALKTLDCVVCGYTKGEGWRTKTLGALILGAYHGGELTYVGRVGTGFTEKMLEEILAILRPYASEKCPFRETPEMGPQVASWLRPEAVCEVDCLLITADLMLRAPSFIRMRNDKAPEECVI